MNNLKFIKSFSKITVKRACEKCGVKSASNVWAGRVSEENLKKIKDSLVSDTYELLQQDINEHD